jgi:hypothetical protein
MNGLRPVCVDMCDVKPDLKTNLEGHSEHA